MQPLNKAPVPHGATLAHWLACAALAWGTFAFGAVYAWAYVPLALLCAVAGLSGLANRRGLRVQHHCAPLVVSMVLVGLVILAQLVPVPTPILASLSPRRMELLRQLDVGVAAGLVGTHPLSLKPDATVRAILLYAAFALLLLGLARSASRKGALHLASAVAWLGLAVAVIGIIQKPLYHGAIYGFWQPLTSGSVFGPFVNRNHFAGWMVMAIPLTFGYVCALISRERGRVGPTAREWAVWFASGRAMSAVRAACALAVMALSLALTLSRSGVLSLGIALTLCGCLAMQRRNGMAGRHVVLGCLALSALMIPAWAGADALVARFAIADTVTLSGRLPIWAGATSILDDFWVLGSGLNTYGVATLFYPAPIPGYHVAEAHNDYLQLAIEGGVLLAVPILATIAAFIVQVRRRFAATDGSTYWIRLGALGGIVAVAVQSVVEFSLQVPGNAALFSVLCALALHRPGVRTHSDRTEGTPRSTSDTACGRSKTPQRRPSPAHQNAHRCPREHRDLRSHGQQSR
jgi:O-antigen ligase